MIVAFTALRVWQRRRRYVVVIMCPFRRSASVGPGWSPRRCGVSMVEMGIAQRANTTTTSKEGTVQPLLARATWW